MLLSTDKKEYNQEVNKVLKTPKFDFEIMKAQATSFDRAVRKRIFKEYFEQFGEFPSYLFDNDPVIDARLTETIQDLTNDPETSKAMQKGLSALIQRLPATEV